MKINRTALIAVICTLIIVGGIGIWIATMPYPIKMWWEARQRRQYSEKLLVSEADFKIIKQIVMKSSINREIIYEVHPIDKNEIQIRTLSYWKAPLYSGGGLYTVTKVEGKWSISKMCMWES